MTPKVNKKRRLILLVCLLLFANKSYRPLASCCARGLVFYLKYRYNGCMTNTTTRFGITHEISGDGLTLTSQHKRDDGATYKRTVVWNDLTTAQANYEKAKADNFESFTSGKTDGNITSQSKIRTVKVLGRNVTFGKLISNEWDEASISLGKKKYVVGSKNGKLKLSTGRFVNVSSQAGLLFGIGTLRKAVFVSV